MEDMTYNVRVYKTRVYKGRKVTTYYVRWKVGSREWKEPYRTTAQADSFRSSLIAAARNGEAFSVATGRPASWRRSKSSISWYTFTLDYAAAKWPYASPNHRRGIAEALTDATEVMLTTDVSPYSHAEIREALRTWAYSSRLHGNPEPPSGLAPVLDWLRKNTVTLAALSEDGQGSAIVRRMLDRISRKQDGSLAAANTANRKRMVVSNALEYACETGALPNNPVKRVKWRRPRTLKTVDPRVVINAAQAQRLLAAVQAQGQWGQRLVAFFACMYYAALRPEEAIDLRPSYLLKLPNQGWGEMRLSHAAPRSGSKWTDSGASRERRELKHRAVGDIRIVPVHPQLARLLREHLSAFPCGSDRRIFTGPRGGLVAERTYLEVYHAARASAFTAQEAASPLAETPYALRHAAVSTWLNAGVAPPQVAEWAGHSVDVLLRVYAKCIDGQQEEAKRRIEDATRVSEEHVNLATDHGV